MLILIFIVSNRPGSGYCRTGYLLSRDEEFGCLHPLVVETNFCILIKIKRQITSEDISKYDSDIMMQITNKDISNL